MVRLVLQSIRYSIRSVNVTLRNHNLQQVLDGKLANIRINVGSNFQTINFPIYKLHLCNTDLLFGLL
jgi:hypothetical protein